MNDIEISKALALAIGWKELDDDPDVQTVWSCYGPAYVEVWFNGAWRNFDYRDWGVISPIATRYRLVVDFGDNSVCDELCRVFYSGNTPQKAIAMAVIEGTKA